MPFRNLKLLIMLEKALGLFSCNLVNGRLKSSSTWSCCFCIIWILFHCLYMGIYYYERYIDTPIERTKKDKVLDILQSSMGFVSFAPYYIVAAFWSENFVKLSDKLLTYDEQAIALEYPRKDKHIFTYLFFVYTFIILSWESYYDVGNAILEGRSEGILEGISFMLRNVVPNVSGTYRILIMCMFLDLIRQRFRHLNETIVPHVSELPVTGSLGEITVYDVRYLHGVLLDSAELINALYGIGALLTLMSTLLGLISITYTIIKNLQQHKNIQELFIDVLDLLIQNIYLFTMYHFTTYEANRVEERVIKYGLPFSNKKCRMDKIEMMLYFYHRRYSFTAAEFFELDMTIFLPIATVVMTYLTLIV
ncbi:uncharacterized protein [Temnothorax longispinosus]|uniref:uncharacterized protein n=1 Tax=Temnothorax longispinosus TaxID=300112 RepID=UPI003A997338